MKRFIAVAAAALMSLAALLPAMPAQASGPTADPLLLAPKFIDQGFSQSVAAGTGLTTAFTYTVPSGRMFRLQFSKAVAQTGVSNGCNAGISPVNAVATATASPAYYLIDSFYGSADYPAGTVISGTYQNSGAATCIAAGTMHGIEYNAP